MNFLPIILLAFLLGGDKIKSVKEFLSKIDFNSFLPILKVLGVNEKTLQFLCSEKFSSFLNSDGELKEILPLLFSALKGEDENNKGVKDEPTASDCEKLKDVISPIKNVAPTEVEETFSSYLS